MVTNSSAPRHDLTITELEQRITPRRLLSPVAGNLAKLAKHLAVIACLMIVGAPSGRSYVGEVGIFLIVVLAAALNCSAGAVRRRLAINGSLARRPP
jgi:hypothetical protein